MIKLTILLRRRPDLTRDAFVSYHRTAHAQLFMSVPVVRDNVRRYVQQHAVAQVPDGLPAADYDGTTELWFDDAEAMTRVFTDPGYLEHVRPDEAKFLDLPACGFLLTAENVVLAG